MTPDLEPPKELIEKWTAEFEDEYRKGDNSARFKKFNGEYISTPQWWAHRYYIKARTAGWRELQTAISKLKYAPPIRPNTSPRMGLAEELSLIRCDLHDVAIHLMTEENKNLAKVITDAIFRLRKLPIHNHKPQRITEQDAREIFDCLTAYYGVEVGQLDFECWITGIGSSLLDKLNEHSIAAVGGHLP